jgi:hypothetical protein
MPQFNCGNRQCKKEFYSKHSTAKYCSRRCSGIVTMSNPEIKERHRKRMNSTYTDEKLIARLIEQAGELGRTPTTREVANPSDGVYINRFGSYTNAVLMAGLTPNQALPKQYLEKNRRSIPLSLRFKVLERDGFACRYCGGTPQEGYILHVDHVIPVAQGGLNEEENLVAACWLCNSGKGDSPAPVAQRQSAHRQD